jgi:azurin
MKNLRMLTLAVVLGVSLLLSACGNNGGGGAASGGAAGGGTAGGNAATIDIGSDGENLAFDKTTLTATAGQQVTLNFKNNSSAQQHNWVLVKGGEDVAAAVASAGLTAGPEANYLPSDQSQVHAATPLANGGETQSVSFTAPEAGTYEYICTVPGHYPLMRGSMTVN